MRIAHASAQILTPYIEPGSDQAILNAREDVYTQIVRAARICYQSEWKGKEPETVEDKGSFIHHLIAKKHLAMLDHTSAQVLFTVDRGVSHEVVRHRMSAFAQESTRYCNYSLGKFDKNVTYIDIRNAFPLDKKMAQLPEDKIALIESEWEIACLDAENHYMKMIELGASPQIARSVLNNSTKTQLVMTADMTEWRHFFNLRAVGATGKPHPQMQEVAVPLLHEFASIWPAIFEDIEKELEE